MKKHTLFFVAVLITFMLTACVKNKPAVPVNTPDNTAVTGEAATHLADVTSTPAATSNADSDAANGNSNVGTDTSDTHTTDSNESIGDDATPEPTAAPVTPAPTPEIKAVPTSDELCTAYAQVLTDLAYENELVDDIVFSTVDVNSDGVRELLYAESSVHASGVYVCYYNNGEIFTTGPFGCYGGMKYVPEDGRIISAFDNMEYMTYEFNRIDENYNAQIIDRFSIEPDSLDDGYHYFHNDIELTHDAFALEFAPLQALKTRSIDYYDMYWYCWCNDEYDPLFERLNKMLEEEECGRDCRLIIPADEKAKLIGAWTIYSHEFDGDEQFAADGNIEGKVVIDENYIVTLYNSDTEIWYKDMDMFFVNGAYSDYMDNTDWYVWLSGTDLGGDEFYMNVTSGGQLCMNYINTENDEYYISAWSLYDRVSE